MENNKMRCHFSIIFEKAGSFLVFWLILVANKIDDIIEVITASDFSIKSIPYILPVCLGLTLLLLIILGYQFLVWRKTFIYLDGDTFVVERNTLNRQKSTFAISSLANINLEQNLLERLIGTYRLKLDTDSFSTADSTDVSIVLSASNATALKEELLTLMKKEPLSETVTVSGETENASPETITYASTKEVLSHCFFSIPTRLLFLTFAVIIGVPLYLYLNNISIRHFIIDDIAGSSGNLLAVFLLVITYGYSFAKQLLSFYHFRCFRQGNDIRIQYGFLKNQDFTIPLKRINAIQISQPPLSRLTGRMQAQLICIGVGDSETEKPQLTLCMKKEKFYTHMQELLPEFSTEAIQEIHKLPKGSATSYFISCLSLLLLFSVGYWGGIALFGTKVPGKMPLCICYGITVFLIILYQFLHYFSLGTEIEEKQLVIHSGSFRKEIWLIPYHKIQYVDLQQNPVSRLFQIAKGKVHILASLGNSTVSLPFTSLSKINELKEELLN